jgi:hypothetical protein
MLLENRKLDASPSAIFVSSFQITSEGKIMTEWSRSLVGSKALNHETYLKTREIAILASCMLSIRNYIII